MPIATTCPKCKKSLKVADNLAGKTVRCPACKTPLAVMSPALASRAGGKTPRPVAAPRLHIHPGLVVLAVIILAIPATLLAYKLGPGAVADEWGKLESTARDDVESVANFLIRAKLSHDGSFNPNKSHAVPHVTDLTFLFPPLRWSMPDKIGFVGASTEGQLQGFFFPATHEVELDIELGGSGLTTGIVLKRGTASLHGTGRIKAGAVTAEIDGKPADILTPPREDE